MRVDAQRNRDRILEAARSLVTTSGIDATMEDIARRAGVAVGTLYRHFPAKSDLVTAVLDDSLEQMAALNEQTLEAAGDEPGAALLALFREVAERHAVDMAFKEAAGRLDITAELAAAKPGSPAARAVVAITELLHRAQAAGQIRADIGFPDLVVLLSGVPGVQVPAPMRSRYVEIVVAGLAPTTER